MNLRRRLGAIAAPLVLLGAACGGSDAPAADDGVSDQGASERDQTAEVQVTPIPEPSATAIVIATSTPLPTSTPEPTSTALPLEAPTPSAILLGSAFTNDSKVTTVGIDEVFFGMTPDEAAAAASTEWLGTPLGTSNCYRVAPAAGPTGVELWIVDGFVERVEIEHPDLRTPSQLGIGNSLVELQGQLGERLSTETLDDGTTVATFTPTDSGDRDFRIIFELVDDSVVRYRSGRVGIVERPADACPSNIEG